MARPGDVLEAPSFGARIEFRRTAAETGGELVEFDVVGKPRGMIAQAHVHPGQQERLEVIEGAMKLREGGRTRILRAGEVATTPPGTAHRHATADGEPYGRVRVQARPARRTEAWLERLAQYDREGQVTQRGWLKPVAAAQLTVDFEGEGHAAGLPPRAQLALARAILGAARALDNDYVFVDEWDVAAPIDAVFAALEDGRTYPEWWRPVYLAVDADGPSRLGHSSSARFKGRLPYQLKTRTTTVRHEPPHVLAGDVEGHLRGRGTWTLGERPGGGTHVRFDWRVSADRPFLRALTPVLRPLFRWNHAWAIARAREGLEPFAQRLAAAA
jgi:quercetin dioxygenase-like cupin family protein/uncharacterized protein YndB with AHSA1/START domain